MSYGNNLKTVCSVWSIVRARIGKANGGTKGILQPQLTLVVLAVAAMVWDSGKNEFPLFYKVLGRGRDVWERKDKDQAVCGKESRS